MLTLTLDSTDKESGICLKDLAESIHRSKKIISLTGAGISCSAGIPDFRSADGLYNFVKEKYPKAVVKGKDLFDVSLFRSHESLSVFCTFMESLYAQTLIARPTETHKFLQMLNRKKKMIKCYTQNIDGLERRLDMTTGTNGKWKELQVVQLHGDIHKLSCTNCCTVFEWSQKFREQMQDGAAPDCPQCEDHFFLRMTAGKRMSSSTVGILRPNIVLYGENHPHSEALAKGLNQDIRRNPNILLIFGTSLKVDGVKQLVRNLSKSVHEKPGGLVVLVNATPVSAAWEKVIDIHIQADCDSWVLHLKQHMPALFAEPAIMTPPATPKKRKADSTTPATERHDRTLPSPEYSPSKSSPKKRRVVLEELLNLADTLDMRLPGDDSVRELASKALRRS